MRALLALITPARVAAFQAWRKQPTTIAGIGAVSATLTAVGRGQLRWTMAVPLLLGSAVLLVLEDNTAAASPGAQSGSSSGA